MATNTTFVEVTLVTQTHEIRKLRRFIAGLGFLPRGLCHRLMNRILLYEEKRYVMQDVVIWERKRYQSPPRLCRADGPIGKYRLYCRQFYPELLSQTAPTPQEQLRNALTGG